MKNENLQCVVFGFLGLALGCVCHRLCPGLGVVLMPMFWPLAVLSARVSTRKAVLTAALVPFAAFLLTGMPAFPVVVAVKFAVLSGVAALLWRRLARLRRR